MSDYTNQAVRSDLTIKKSNDFILSKYNMASPLEGKVLAFSLTRLQIKPDGPEARFRASELKNLLYGEGSQKALSDKNIYPKLRSISKSLTSNHSIFIEDEKERRFVSFALVTECSYSDGIFTIQYNKKLTPFVSDLKKNFTTYGIQNIVRFNSVYSLKLYEILRKELYRVNSSQKEAVIEYGLSELRALLGLFEMKESGDMEELRKKGFSWEEIELQAKSRKMTDYNNFKRRVLDKAIEEINHFSDIYVRYTGITGGAGGKTIGITFFISKNQTKNLPKDLEEYVGHNGLTKENLLLFLKEAGSDEETVINVIKMCDEAPSVGNYIGFIRKGIKEGWSTDKIETIYGSKKDAERAREIKREIDEAKKDPNGAMFVKMWENMKKREEFPEYFSQLTEKERDYIEFLDYETRVESFINWKKSRV